MVGVVSFHQIEVSTGNRLTICTSSNTDHIGIVRAYKMPLTGEFFDFVAHSGPVTRLCVSPDETVIVTAGVDGSISFFTVCGGQIDE